MKCDSDFVENWIFFLHSFLTYSQIWLIPLLDDHQYDIKLQEENPHVHDSIIWLFKKSWILYCYCSWVGQWEMLFEYPNGLSEELHLCSGIWPCNNIFHIQDYVFIVYKPHP